MLQVFNSPTGQQVRVVDKDGDPWFVAADVAGVLGYVRPRDAVSQHCKGAVKHRTPTSGGAQDLTIIPESDVYRLIFRSKLPAAERFEDWVTKDVLPAIRKGGSYHITPQLPDFTNPAVAARAWADEHEARQLALTQVAVLTHRVQEDKPKVQAAEQFLRLGHNVSLTDAAKTIGVPPRALIAWMESVGYIHRDRYNKHVPAQVQINRGRLALHVSTSGYNQTLVTPKGVIWLNTLCSGDAE